MGYLPNLKRAGRFVKIHDQILEQGLNHVHKGILDSHFQVLRESISNVLGLWWQ
ncbi:hypothetical protein V1387_18260 [Allomuricauda taeanensis]|uniref:hypothetical protein n=1 Tax=Flagellimonas taeanensis TaxID=1005926 RepID=UPI002E7B332D|nr:hypothetical protein [Allomuricauda taeanensis]MEE1964635.1 hypothetical protein [Allomuricauda taeanensis]